MEEFVDKMENKEQDKVHILNDTWTLWAHLPHDTDWSLKSYKKILTFNSIEEAISITETIPQKMVRNCMLFLMREGIKPIWEDERNRMGGSFSYKVSNKIVPSTWRNLSYTVIGETLATKTQYNNFINGITISPKKNFCVIKVWMSNCDKQDPNIIREVHPGIISAGCLFKKHNPEY